MPGEIALKFVGPPQQVCYALAEEGHSARLVPQKIYLLSPDLAESLLRSSKHWVEIAGALHEEEGELVEHDIAPPVRENNFVNNHAIRMSSYQESEVPTQPANS